MKRFMVSDSEVIRNISQLTDVSTESEAEHAFSRAALSLITEPGDRFAGALVKALSSDLLLELLVAKASFKSFESRLLELEALEEIEARFGNFADALADARQRWSPRLKLGDVTSALLVAVKCHAKLLTPSAKFWPSQLNDLGGATPHCLWYRAKMAEPPMMSASISIVGSRNSTSYGDWVTTEIVADSSARGLAIVSGGAYGIDAIAHRSAIANHSPTIAFMAGGIDRLYPSGNAALFERVIEQGALVAEQAPGASPTKWRFLQRNRLIAAMSTATVVVEAGRRSGALNTVTHAIELGRSIGAVPGPITSQSSAGCNRLISEGLVSSVLSIGEAADLALGSAGWFQPELSGLGALETRALDAMNLRPLSESQIASRAGLTAKEIAIALGQLSLLGIVKQADNGWLKLAL